MKTDTNAVDLTRLVDTLEKLGQELGRLSQRVAALETATVAPVATGAAVKNEVQSATSGLSKSPTPAGPSVEKELSEELLLVISAAIAAFVGKKAHIRQIRLIGSAAWAQVGRVTIQASHALSVHSARS